MNKGGFIYAWGLSSNRIDSLVQKLTTATGKNWIGAGTMDGVGLPPNAGIIGGMKATHLILTCYPDCSSGLEYADKLEKVCKALAYFDKKAVFLQDVYIPENYKSEHDYDMLATVKEQITSKFGFPVVLGTKWIKIVDHFKG